MTDLPPHLVGTGQPTSICNAPKEKSVLPESCCERGAAFEGKRSDSDTRYQLRCWLLIYPFDSHLSQEMAWPKYSWATSSWPALTFVNKTEVLYHDVTTVPSITLIRGGWNIVWSMKRFRAVNYIDRPFVIIGRGQAILQPAPERRSERVDGADTPQFLMRRIEVRTGNFETSIWENPRFDGG